MHRSAVIMLAVVVVLVTALTGLMLYVTVLYTATKDAESVAVVMTLPSPTARPATEPDGAMVRLVFILSILAVFVSAVLVLLRLLGKVPFED